MVSNCIQWNNKTIEANEFKDITAAKFYLDQVNRCTELVEERNKQFCNYHPFYC